MKKLFLSILGLVVAASAYAVTPADPTNLLWYDCGDESGDSYLTFTLPTVDVNGNPLDIEMMGYRIYTDDDQIFTFTRSVYTNDDLWGNITDVYNYQWAEGSDIQGSGLDTLLYLWQEWSPREILGRPLVHLQTLTYTISFVGRAVYHLAIGHCILYQPGMSW